MVPRHALDPCVDARPVRRPHDDFRRLTAERGFSLVELLIVMLVIGILMAIVVPSIRAPRSVAEQKAIRAAAASYNQAIQAFALDHSGRVPCPASCPATFATDWDSRLAFGPAEPLPGAGGQVRRYMRQGAPEVVQGDLADFQITPMAAGQSLPASGAGGVIVYVRAADVTKYRLEVWVRGTDNRAQPSCWYGNLPPTGGTWPRTTTETC